MNITVPPSPDGRARRAREEEGTGRETGFHRHVKSFFRDCKKKKDKMQNLTGFHQAVGAEVLGKDGGTGDAPLPGCCKRYPECRVTNRKQNKVTMATLAS